MTGKVLMTSSAKSFEPITKGMTIPIPEERRKDFVCGSKNGRYCYVQHDHTISFADGRPNPNHGKLFVRDTLWTGALKAFILNWDRTAESKGLVPVSLKVLRLSTTGKSLICNVQYESMTND